MMQAVRLEAVEELFLREVPRPEPAPDEVLVHIEAAGICGTDRHLLHGEFPSRPPVTLGHEFSGIVAAVGREVTGLREGQRVTCDPNIVCGRCARCREGRVNLCQNLTAIGIHRDGGLAEFAAIPQHQAFGLPDRLDPAFGAFCEPLACCLHGVDFAAIRPGQSVVVLGGGVIGLLVVQLARLAGAGAIVLSTRQAARRDIARKVGATHVIDPTAGDPVEALTGPGGIVPGGADIVIECAGVAETMQQMCRMARTGGTVVMLGVMARGVTVPIEPFDILVRELKLLGSFVNPFTHQRAADLVSSGELDLEALITRRAALDDIAGIIRAAPGPGDVKALYMPAFA